MEAKRAAKKAAATIPTFRVAAEAVHAERAGDYRNDKHKAQWINTLTTYAFPSIGDRPITKVTRGDVRDLIVATWWSKPRNSALMKETCSLVALFPAAGSTGLMRDWNGEWP